MERGQRVTVVRSTHEAHAVSSVCTRYQESCVFTFMIVVEGPSHSTKQSVALKAATHPSLSKKGYGQRLEIMITMIMMTMIMMMMMTVIMMTMMMTMMMMIGVLSARCR